MSYTNINIHSSFNSYKYIIEYSSSDILESDKSMQYRYNYSDVELFDKHINLVRDNNIWYPIKYNEIIGQREHLPSQIKLAKIKLYFPQFSVDTYVRNVKYVLSVYTWIHGRKISLGNYLYSRLDACACEPKRFFGDNYQEYIQFDVIDPWELNWSDDWADFRVNVCDSLGGKKNVNEPNSVGSVIYFSLYAVEEIEGKYITIDKFQGGQNSINITNGKSDYLNLNIKSNIDEKFDEPKIICNVEFNKSYNDLDEYLKETYNLNTDSYHYRSELIIKDNDNIYFGPSMWCELDTDGNKKYNEEREYIYDIENPLLYEFTQTHIGIGNWSEFKEGMTIMCSFSILNDNEDEILYLKSNEIPLTQELFSYFVNESIKNVNLDNIDMNIYNINAVNKTINEVVRVIQPQDSKTHIIQPVFIKTHSVGNLQIEPNFTENIQLNLDAYKAYVDSFILQVGGCNFVEIGRNSGGVIFKIVGNMLPKDITSGTYYILNQDSELITSGKYSYVS